ncbi:MAG: T9SS type A sorting domain-containing protein [Bacteroidales bacterium]|nr:T9SS type A sorting domain-containing protein [Bacteroidales bacterium]
MMTIRRKKVLWGGLLFIALNFLTIFNSFGQDSITVSPGFESDKTLKYSGTYKPSVNIGILESEGVSKSFTINGSLEYSGGKYHVNSVADLIFISYIVNENKVLKEYYKNFQGKEIVLDDDIDLATAVLNEDNPNIKTALDNFVPIGYTISKYDKAKDKWEIDLTGDRGFVGTFNGNNKIINNLKITQYITIRKTSNTATNVGGGLFGYVRPSQDNKSSSIIKNITIKNAEVKINVSNHTEANLETISWGSAFVVGILQCSNVDGCSVSNSKINATTNDDESGQGTAVGGIVGEIIGQCSSDVDDCSVSNCQIAADYNANAVVGLLSEKAASANPSLVEKVNTMNDEQAKNNLIADKGKNDESLKISAYSLYAGRWNFVSGLNTKASVFNNNNQNVDMAVITFDYSNGEHGNDWKYYSDEDYLLASSDVNIYEGYMVWPFKNDYKMNPKISDGTNVTIGTTQLEYEGLQTLPMALENTANSVAITTMKNEGKENTSGSYTATKWFALANPFNTNVPVNILVSNITGKNNDNVYVFRDGGWHALPVSGSFTVNAGEGFMIPSDKGQISGSLTRKTKKSTLATKDDTQNDTDETEYLILPPEKFVFTQEDKEENSNIIFNVFANGTNKQSFAKVNKGSVDGYDLTDSYIMKSPYAEDLVEPYFVVDNREILINQFKSLPYECPINFYAKKVSAAELFVSNVPDGMDVSIINKEDGTETLLTNGESFYFTATEGENDGRFVIRFAKKNASISDVKPNNADITITNADNFISVSAKNLKNVQIINSLGQVVYNKAANSDTHSLTLNTQSGIYIVKAKSADGEKTEKIVIK